MIPDVLVLQGNPLVEDAGLLFGGMEQSCWKKWVSPDNCVELVSNVLLIQTNDLKILFDPGPGPFRLSGKAAWESTGEQNILKSSLEKQGIHADEITHIFLSHLHMASASGLLSKKRGPLLFENAVYYTGKDQFDRSKHPHILDEHLFMPELAVLLEESDQLELISGDSTFCLGNLTLSFLETQGHTPGMLLPFIDTGEQKILFAGDIIPGPLWRNLLIHTGFDRYPELLIDEKRKLLETADRENSLLFYPFSLTMEYSGPEYQDEI